MNTPRWQPFEVTYYDHVPRYVYACQVSFGHYELQYVAGGGVELEIDGCRHEVTAGGGWLNLPGHEYRYRPLPRYGWWDHRFIVFSNATGDAWRAAGLLPETPWRAPAGTDLGAAMDQIMALAPRFHDPCCRIDALNLLERIFLDLHGPAIRVGPPWLAAVLQTLDGDARPPDYATLAARHGMSLRTLFRQFQEWTGLTPHQYYVKARVRQAARLLETTGLSQKEIAARLGYADPAHFARQFKTVTGHSPGAVRTGGSGVGGQGNGVGATLLKKGAPPALRAPQPRLRRVAHMFALHPPS